MSISKAPDSVFDVVQGVLDEFGTAFSSASELEKEIWFLTSMEPGLPTKRELNKISRATRNRNDLQLIVKTLVDRMRDTHWRFISKAIYVTDHCLDDGDERFEQEMRRHASVIQRLSKYKYIDDEGNDRGFEVRKAAKKLLQKLTGETPRDAGSGYGRRSPSPVRGGRGSNDPFAEPIWGAQRPDYEKEGTGLFSGNEDEDADELARRRHDESGRGAQARDGSPARRRSGAGAAGDKDKAPWRPSGEQRKLSGEVQQLADKMAAVDLKKPAYKATPVQAPVASRSLLDDDGDDDFGEFSAGPSAPAPAMDPALMAVFSNQTPLNVGPSAPRGSYAPVRPMTPTAARCLRPMASAPPRPSANQMRPTSSSNPNLFAQQPRTASPAKSPEPAAGFAGLVNLDAQALKRGGDILNKQQQQQQQKKGAPIGQIKWQPN